MTYGEFLEYVSSKCLHETIYTDSDGHPILVIRLLDAYGMVNKLQRPWVGLEKKDMPDGEDPMYDHPFFIAGMVWAANKLKEKNT